MEFINVWNLAGTFVSSNGITMSFNFPISVLNGANQTILKAVFEISFRLIPAWKYPEVKSILVRYFAFPIWSRQS